MYEDHFDNESRNALHNGQKSQRILSENHNAVGMAGEFAFGEFCGLWPDTTDRVGGDNGFDFIVPLKFTVDIKTARKAFHLIHEKGKNFADIYVLAEYDDESNTAQLIGWEFGKTLEKAPTKDFGYGVINHYIRQKELRPMSELKNRMFLPLLET